MIVCNVNKSFFYNSLKANLQRQLIFVCNLYTSQQYVLKDNIQKLHTVSSFNLGGGGGHIMQCNKVIERKTFLNKTAVF